MLLRERSEMANAIDVAAYILEQIGSVTTMKLQKLVYYTQVRYLVMNGRPLFSDEIQAWANGPVAPNLYRIHSGRYMIGRGGLGQYGSVDALSFAEKAAASYVVSKLGALSGEQLRSLSHSERPWQDARKGYAPGARCSVPISIESMKSFYSSPECSNPVVR